MKTRKNGVPEDGSGSLRRIIAKRFTSGSVWNGCGCGRRENEMVLRLMYEPQELVDTSNLSNEEWLSYRRRGIGGSDAAAILRHFALADSTGSVL